jgi:hypothetical protein
VSTAMLYGGTWRRKGCVVACLRLRARPTEVAAAVAHQLSRAAREPRQAEEAERRRRHSSDHAGDVSFRSVP